jgi:hypothetical protein
MRKAAAICHHSRFYEYTPERETIPLARLNAADHERSLLQSYSPTASAWPQQAKVEYQTYEWMCHRLIHRASSHSPRLAAAY